MNSSYSDIVSIRPTWALLAALAALVPAAPGAAQSGGRAQFIMQPWPGLHESPPGVRPLPKEADDPTPPNIVAPHVRAPLTDAVRGVAAANNQFAADLFGQLRLGRDIGDNLLVSPQSISTALAMTYAGGRGRNAEQIAAVLHLDGLGDDAHAGYGEMLTDLNSPREGYDLSVVNRLFGQEGFLFRESFLDRLANDYQAPVEWLDFYHSPEPSRNHINGWVADQTNQRVKDLLPGGSITEETRLVLTNAVYFNGQWKYEFNKELTREAPFHLAHGAAGTVPTMYQRNVFDYGQFADFQMLEMPYAGDDLSMVVMLPNDRDGLAELEASLTAELFEDSVESLEKRKVDVFLPKFEFKDGAKLKNPLKALGMSDAFSGGDFSGISDIGLEIDEVYHKTFIDVNESGTEAAAATAVVMTVTTALLDPPPPPVFRADHPFLFALRDAHTGSLLFLGRMADPEAAAASAGVPEPMSLALSLGAAVALIARRPRSPAFLRENPPSFSPGH